MRWNKNYFGLLDNVFGFLDNNLGGSRRYLHELCEALIPLKKTWGRALTFNVLKDEETVRLMAKAGCRYVYTGLESLNPDSIKAMNKGQNKISRSEEHTSELQSRQYLVCRLLLEKKQKKQLRLE